MESTHESSSEGAEKPPPRRFQSSIPLSEPSRRSQVLVWVFVIVALACGAFVAWLYFGAGYSLWFSR